MSEKSAAIVARENGIDPKELRRYLRAAPSWNNPGTGKRYMFNPSDERALLRGFHTWKISRQSAGRRVDEETNG
jgi:hypothetical protein